MNCRFCKNSLKEEFINLGIMAPANSYVLKKNIKKKHKEYPLKILVCEKCWLVQTEDFTNKEEFFSESYAYFSSTSKSWLNHAKEYSLWLDNKLVAHSKTLNKQLHSIRTLKTKLSFTEEIGCHVIKILSPNDKVVLELTFEVFHFLLFFVQILKSNLPEFLILNYHLELVHEILLIFGYFFGHKTVKDQDSSL